MCVHVTVTYQLRERKSTVAEPVTPAIAFYVCIVHSKWFDLYIRVELKYIQPCRKGQVNSVFSL